MVTLAIVLLACFVVLCVFVFADLWDAGE